MHMFVPHRLAIVEHPEIDVLPQNILFARSKMQDGKIVTGSALYSPDISTLQVGKHRIALTYRNPMNSSWIVVVEYDTERKSWKAKKSANGKDIVLSAGNTWDGIFKQLTLSGLQNGEPCEFLNSPAKPSS